MYDKKEGKMKDLLTRRIYDKILVDAMNMCYIHYHGQMSLSHNGKRTGMLYGIARAVTKLQKEHPNAKIIFLWEGNQSRRQTQYSLYKSHRKDKPSEFHEHVLDVKKYLTAAGVDQIHHIGLEADDMAGYICLNATENILLVTSDADWFQFMKPDQIDIMRGKIETFDDLQATLGFPPNKMGMWKILKGDKSDGITGIYRFPSSVARLLVNKCESYKEFKYYPLESHNPIWDKWEDTIQDLWDSIIERNAELVLFHPEWIETSQIITVEGNLDKQELLAIYTENGFKSLLYSIL